MSGRSNLLIGLAAGAAVVVVAAAGLWWWLLRDNAPPPAALPVRAATSDGSSTFAGSWHVQQGPRVFIGYRMLELFGGDTLRRTTAGRSGGVAGTLVLTQSRVTSATITADLSQLKSDEARRDRYLRTHALETANVRKPRLR